MTEELDGIGSIDISSHPGTIDTGVGAEIHHSERPAGGAEKYPAGIGGINQGINQINRSGGDSYARISFVIAGWEEGEYESEKKECEGN